MNETMMSGNDHWINGNSTKGVCSVVSENNFTVFFSIGPMTKILYIGFRQSIALEISNENLRKL